MAIKDIYVKEYMPIHELPPVTTFKQDLDGPFGGFEELVDLGPEDLFMISKMQSLDPDDESNVILSKSLTFQNLTYRISTDVNLQGIRNDISSLSADLFVVSSDLLRLSTEVDEKYADVTSTISSISTILSASISSLSDDYILKYGDQLCSVAQGHIIRNITMTDGKITHLDVERIDDAVKASLSKTAIGMVLGDIWDNTACTSSIANSETDRVEYVISNDCYLQIDLDVLESDSVCRPLEVYMETVGLDENYNVDPNNKISRMVAQFNNPGGYPGTTYKNFYSFGMPIKAQVYVKDNIETHYTKIVIKYRDESAFLYDSDSENNTTIRFTPYKLHGSITASELDKYVTRDTIYGRADTLGLYNIQTNENGLVVKAVGVTSNELTRLIGTANSNTKGVIGIGYTSTVNNNYPLTVDSNGRGYVNVPIATASQLGVVKTVSGYQYAGNNLGSDISLSVNAQSGDAITRVPYSDSGIPGLVKASPVNTEAVFAGLKDNKYIDVPFNSDRRQGGQGFTRMFSATDTRYGLVKTGTNSNKGDVYVGNGGKLVVNFGTPESWMSFLNSSLLSWINTNNLAITRSLSASIFQALGGKFEPFSNETVITP